MTLVADCDRAQTVRGSGLFPSVCAQFGLPVLWGDNVRAIAGFDGETHLPPAKTDLARRSQAALAGKPRAGRWFLPLRGRPAPLPHSATFCPHCRSSARRAASVLEVRQRCRARAARRDFHHTRRAVRSPSRVRSCCANMAAPRGRLPDHAAAGARARDRISSFSGRPVERRSPKGAGQSVLATAPSRAPVSRVKATTASQLDIGAG
jgi:hypothetical protein